MSCFFLKCPKMSCHFSNAASHVMKCPVFFLECRATFTVLATVFFLDSLLNQRTIYMSKIRLPLPQSSLSLGYCLATSPLESPFLVQVLPLSRLLSGHHSSYISVPCSSPPSLSLTVRPPLLLHLRSLFKVSVCSSIMDSARESDATNHLPVSVPAENYGLQANHAGGFLLQDASGMPDVHLVVEEPPLEANQTPPGPPPAPTPEPENDGIQTTTPSAQQNSLPGETEGEGDLFQADPIKPFLVVKGQVVVALVTMFFSNGSLPLSHNAKILRYFAAGSNIVGFIAFFTRILMCGRRRGLATRIVTAMGYAGVAYGFIALLVMLLPDNISLWMALGACALCLPAIAAAIRG